jgi:hypothetical protein
VKTNERTQLKKRKKNAKQQVGGSRFAYCYAILWVGAFFRFVSTLFSAMKNLLLFSLFLQNAEQIDNISLLFTVDLQDSALCVRSSGH